MIASTQLRRAGQSGAIVALVMACVASASGQCTTRVSVASDGTQANGASYSASVSADGRYVAFHSTAMNLIPDDWTSYADVLVHDRATGATTIVSVRSDGTHGNLNSSSPSLSADGRYVAFQSDATNLVAGDTNTYRDVFVHDRTTGVTNRVSIASNGAQANYPSQRPAISADGRFVAFTSTASNLVPGDTNGYEDVFVHDRESVTTTRISVASDGTQGNNRSGDYLTTGPGISISGDGRYVAFQSRASNLVPGDTNGEDDVFVHDGDSGTTTRVSIAFDGTQGGTESLYASISADGRYVTFQSYASNLVPGDTNGRYDVFVRDRESGTTSRVSIASDGTQGNSDSGSYGLSISADGRYVAFASAASNLVPGDTNTFHDVFVHDRDSGATSRVSVASDGAESNHECWYPAISGDGRYVGFHSLASSLVPGDTNGWTDVFVHDRGAGCPALGDWNGDGDVDFEDFAEFPTCMSGPVGSPDWVMPSQMCRDVFDFDGDTDVDFADFVQFQLAFGGP